MTINPSVREQVRRRAKFACEFCGATEADSGGELTIDHFKPKAKGGDDSLDNLIYCCIACNQYKHAHWPENPNSLSLWNPRHEPTSKHFLELPDGTLRPLTETGAYTLHCLRLNRQPLIDHRLQKRQNAENARLLIHHQEIIRLNQQAFAQLAELIREQRKHIEEQQRIIQLFMENIV
jgi:hypothetical protein